LPQIEDCFFDFHPQVQFVTLAVMTRLITDRLRTLREEIAAITQANVLSEMQKGWLVVAERERRLQRLQEIKDELASFTEWKKT
jgi:hypothetical protein